MASLLKLLLVALFALVVFAKDFFPSAALYWSTYVIMFAIIPLWWVAAYYVSEKKAQTYTKEKIRKSLMGAMVSADVNDDLMRGRICITENCFMVVSKEKVIFTERLENITATSKGKVAGARRGITIYTKEDVTSFTCGKADELLEFINK